MIDLILSLASFAVGVAAGIFIDELWINRAKPGDKPYKLPNEK